MLWLSATAVVDSLFFLEFAEADFVSIQADRPLIEIFHGFSVESLKTAAMLIFHEFVEGGGCGLNWPQNESSDRNVKVNGWNVGTAISQNLEGLKISEQYTISFRYPAGSTNKGLKVALEGFGSARPVKYPASRKPQNNSIHARLSKRRRRVRRLA